MAPNNIPQPRPDEPHGPYSVGAVFEGTFSSYFVGKPLPVPGQNFIGISPKTSIFVLGTARLLDPELPQMPGTDALFSNVLSYLSKDETLAGIRAKGEIIRPLKTVAGPVREIVKYGTVLISRSFAGSLGTFILESSTKLAEDDYFGIRADACLLGCPPHYSKKIMFIRGSSSYSMGVSSL